MLDELKVKRRHFLVGAAGAAGAAALGDAGVRAARAQEASGLPDYVSWKEPGAFIQHSPQTLETMRGEIGLSPLTPNDLVFVRNNLPSLTEEQVGDPEAWEVNVEGVAQPRPITLAELRTLGPETVACVLQCSGNGRGFFEHETSGSQWLTGAAANVSWTGVPVRTVVEAMGGVDGDKSFMTGTGGEPIPEGLDPLTVIVERSVPLEAQEVALLAWEMNGEPIPLAHGGPVRLVLPGYYGVNNVKHLKRLSFDETQSQADIQRSGYRVRPVGESGAPDQPSMYQMNVKSWVTHPLREAGTGRTQIWGVALGGTEDLDRVEVSTDGGETWEEARFVGPDLGRFAWRPFVLAADLAPGTHRIASRATTASGAAQPRDFEPNHRGYGHNGWDAHAVDVTVQ
ncbi:SorT family sulfite dehydrogenase catalytic subunit [Tranquillimonas alkanivorans]|uniref:Sulfite dehydrogenase (Cytochrome) subunit SorA apoprotein n=1 Tax=Tranquillimonas alkanivorans TaxID=441119 RepID=A0A1I5QWD4_9RHOB|nr:sulfite oxidase [Tranquillimonas alkanivorans]SFP50351.1 sulfite dehydrogenase (cytochrome) subunit SorA apoprotein [Tranquillimonas alkanivorans]